MRRLGQGFRGVVVRLRGRRRRVLVVVLISLALVAGCVLMGLVCTPDWYAPPRVSPEEHQDVRNTLVAAEQAFTENLVHGDGGPFVYHVYQEDVNRWIAIRRQINPELDRALPARLSDPFVSFSDGSITVAASIRAAGIDWVVSLDVEPKIAARRDSFVLRATGARCGAVPLALLPGSLGIGLRSLGLGGAVELEPNKAWPGSPPISGNLIDGLKIGTRARWKNGGVTYQLTQVRVLPGRLDLTIEPLGRPAVRYSGSRING